MTHTTQSIPDKKTNITTKIVLQFTTTQATRGRYYSSYTAKSKEDYMLSHIQNRLSYFLTAKNSAPCPVTWDATTWEEILLDDLSFFSQSFDYCRNSRTIFQKTHPELWPNRNKSKK